MKKEGFFGGIYGFGFLGAALYYIVQACTFWQGLLGIVKALVWPAMLMYRLMEYLKM